MEPRVSKVLEEFFSEAERKSTPVLFANIANQEKQREFVKKQNFNFLIYDVEEREGYSPYYPFLEYIKKCSELKSESEINDLIEKSKVYYFQRPLFRNFMLGKAAKRDEDLNSEEFLYEKTELFNGMHGLLSNLKGDTVFLIKNANLLNNSSLEFIEWMIDKRVKGNYSIMLLFDGRSNSLYRDISEIWERLLEKGEDSGYVYNSLESFESNIEEKAIDRKKKKVLTPQQSIRYANECYNFLAYDEAKQLLKEIKIYQGDTGRKESIEIYKMLGDIYFSSGEIESAITNYVMLLEEAVADENRIEICEAYRRLAEAHFNKQNFEISDKYMEQGIKIAEESGEEVLILRSLYTKIILKNRLEIGNLRKWRDIFIKTEEMAKKLFLH